MKNNKIYIISLLIGTLFCTAYYFIKISNDHLDCETVTSFKIDNSMCWLKLKDGGLTKETLSFACIPAR